MSFGESFLLMTVSPREQDIIVFAVAFRRPPSFRRFQTNIDLDHSQEVFNEIVTYQEILLVDIYVKLVRGCPFL